MDILETFKSGKKEKASTAERVKAHARADVLAVPLLAESKIETERYGVRFAASGKKDRLGFTSKATKEEGRCDTLDFGRSAFYVTKGILWAAVGAALTAGGLPLGVALALGFFFKGAILYHLASILGGILWLYPGFYTSVGGLYAIANAVARIYGAIVYGYDRKGMWGMG